VPLYQLLIGIVIFIIWVTGLIFVYTSGDITKNSSGYPWSSVSNEGFGLYLFIFNCFAILWLMAFILMMQVFIIAAAACVWYFQQGDYQEATNKSKRNPLCTAYCWAFTYHMGSIAFGSFILAVIWAIQIILEYIYQQYKKHNPGENKFIECVFKIVKCIVACFERCVKFINQMAFIQIALTGKNFCRAAWAGFMTALAHASEFSILYIMGNFFAFIGIVIIAGGGVGICWIWLMNSDDYKPDSKWNPFMVVCVFSYLVGRIFTMVYLIACDAILQCFFTDVELGKGSGKPPRCTPSELKSFVESARK